MLKAYMIHAGEPQDGATLVFAKSFREAKKLGFNSCVCDGGDYIDRRIAGRKPFGFSGGIARS